MLSKSNIVIFFSQIQIISYNSCSLKQSDPNQNLVSSENLTENEETLLDRIKEKCTDELRAQLLGDQDRKRPPNLRQTNDIYLGLQIDHIISLDQKEGLAKMTGFMWMRWADKRLNWDPAEWGGVEMFQIMQSEMWVPDLVLSNNTDSLSQEYTLNSSANNTIARVWSQNAPQADKAPYNIEWSPLVNLNITHNYEMQRFPLDTQEFMISCESWMTFSEAGQTRTLPLPEASSQFSSPVVINLDESESRFKLLSTRHETSAKSFDSSGRVYYNIKYQFTIERSNMKFFLVIFVPSIIILVLALVNVVIGNDDTKLTNSLQLLLVNSIYLIMTNDLIPQNKTFGLQELSIIAMFFNLFLVTLFLYISQLLNSKIQEIQEYSKDHFSALELRNNPEMVPNNFMRRQKWQTNFIEQFCIILTGLVILICTHILVMSVVQNVQLKYLGYIVNIFFNLFVHQFQAMQKNEVGKVQAFFQLKFAQDSYGAEINQCIQSKFKEKGIKEQTSFGLTFAEAEDVIFDTQAKYLKDFSEYDLRNLLRQILREYDFNNDQRTDLEELNYIIRNYWGFKIIEKEDKIENKPEFKYLTKQNKQKKNKNHKSNNNTNVNNIEYEIDCYNANQSNKFNFNESQLNKDETDFNYLNNKNYNEENIKNENSSIIMNNKDYENSQLKINNIKSVINNKNIIDLDLLRQNYQLNSNQKDEVNIDKQSNNNVEINTKYISEIKKNVSYKDQFSNYLKIFGNNNVHSNLEVDGFIDNQSECILVDNHKNSNSIDQFKNQNLNDDILKKDLKIVYEEDNNLNENIHKIDHNTETTQNHKRTQTE